MDDLDPTETREWLEALDSICRSQGDDRASYILAQLNARATENGIDLPQSVTTHFCNTIPAVREKIMPGDLFMERRIRSLVRWNALAMVMRANAQSEGIGGHIASFSSAATLYDVGFNYFFRGSSDDTPGDLVFFQGHSSPGMYARSFLEGRLSVEQLDKFRREVDGTGLSSYPHPWLMPDYWQFPTVSMGLGPIQAIYQAHVMRYLSARDLVARGNRKVWAFLGDGECDEPETLGAISLAGREGLENLIFVINCNLQRLDGPVRGNGKIIQELEGVFRGAGWNVIKVIWGRHWDQLLERDKSGLLLQRMNEVCDGELQNYKYNGGAYTREHFFGKYPELLELVKDMTDDQIMALNRGGHDPYKVYAAYSEAVESKGHPTVILAHTVKGYGLGAGGQAANDTHSVKKLDVENLKIFRDRFGIPISDDQLETVPYYRPEENSPELIYMNERRASLGGPLPARKSDFEEMSVPALKVFDKQLDSSGEREMSSTMAFVRILSTLIKNKDIGQYVVPIVPDEARTFGMEGMFRQLGIYTSAGQKYVPHDREQIMYYKEDKKGVILEEGINEAGAMSAWLALATAYSTSSRPMIPFYIFYSMFGFQRIGDLAWASGDCQARGFLIGATAGRTTLNGEGLQHQDGHSLILANTIPNCKSYDATYSYELAVIIQSGLKCMFEDKENYFYYLTTMNENYIQPAMPEGVEEGIVRGIYPLKRSQKVTSKKKVTLMGAGTILNEVVAASEILKEKFSVEADIWSLTSVNELVREGQAVDRWNLLHPTETPKLSYVEQQVGNISDPIVIATDYMKAYAEQLRRYLPSSLHVLGTDGFGRSDSRETLRHFFEVDRYFIVVSALKGLADKGIIEQSVVSEAIESFSIDPEKTNPLYM
ncbi:pyruvate dehydrogenase (acetyl-transferring), homodimeric type [Porticoccaceae bacterium]|nr:pyruvate dehydrogenase (acetyl-transferring), homodimeric type [Porticoccaceae bacterium]MDA7571591.1 pyruvate dehydrogenase (acetyl-transferring), homodimeric type [Porticoccaceae bacterium]MDA7769175.1 pyruvate dehydrogenase (acetyl-transferring), homodimeric type [Porticoccaceae bacterium]MDA8598022.1 pyruvate dehydrogenase (acetyl-transferring), homodimeric type [Porticoccaceae bacterium]MDA8878844.1 pyruvate dehydrogenase (acetyl-transferring), homodimeric type [Porticoccaceae bacterium|tara:strand:- start:4230 stop:6881 length:2652 start_codon:yes stop_codon:yes gene_type:complete